MSDAIISVGVQGDLSNFINQFTSQLKGLENLDLGISDALNKEISESIKALGGLKKELTKLSKGKVSSKTFNEFSKSITSQIAILDGRVNILESGMDTLIKTMSSADSSKLQSEMDGIRNSMDTARTSIEQTIGAIKQIQDVGAATGSEVKIIDDSYLATLKRQVSQYEKLVDTYNEKNFKSDFPSNKSDEINLNTKGNFKAQKKYIEEQLRELYDSYLEYNNKIEDLKAQPPELIDEKVITEYQKKMFNALGDFKDLYHAAETAASEASNTDFKMSSLKIDKNFGVEEAYSEVKNALKEQKEELEDEIISIHNTIAKATGSGSGIKTAIESGAEKIKIPIDIETKASELAEKAQNVIQGARNAISRKPIEVEFALVSGLKSQRNKEIMAQLKQGIEGSDLPEDVKKAQSVLYDNINKQIEKDINLRITSSIDTEEKDVNDWIKRIQKTLRAEENKLFLTPEINYTEENLNDLQEKLNSATKGLKLSIENLEIPADIKVNDKSGLGVSNELEKVVESKKKKKSKKKSEDTTESLAKKLVNKEEKTEEVVEIKAKPVVDDSNLDKVSLDGKELLELFNSIQDSINSLSLHDIGEQLDYLYNSVSSFYASFKKSLDLEGYFKDTKSILDEVDGSLNGKNKDAMQDVLDMFNNYKSRGGVRPLEDLVIGSEKAEKKLKWLTENGAIGDNTKAKISIESDVSDIESSIRGKLSSLDDIKVPIKPDVDEFESKVKSILSSLDDIKVPITPEVDEFESKIKGILSTITDIKVPIEADIDDFQSKLQSIISSVDALKVPIELQLKSEAFSEDISKEIAKAKELSNSLDSIKSSFSNLDLGITNENLGLSTTSIEDRFENTFFKIKEALNEIDGRLQGKNLKRMRELLSAYKDYKSVGGERDWTEITDKKNINNWFKKHLSDTYDEKDLSLHVSEQITSAEKGLLQLKEQLTSISQKVEIPIEFNIQSDNISQVLQEELSKLTELSNAIERIQSEFSNLKLNISAKDLGLPEDSMSDRLSKYFKNIKSATDEIDGSLRGKNLNRIREILSAYQDYKRMGGKSDLFDISDKKNINNWFKKHGDTRFEVGENDLSSSNYFTSIEKGIVNLRESLASLSNIDVSGLDKLKSFINSLGNERGADKISSLTANINEFKNAMAGLAGVIPTDLDLNGLNSLKDFISKFGTEKNLFKFDGVTKGLGELIDLLNTDISSDSFLSNLNVLAEKGDVLKDLSTVLKATKNQINTAKNALEPQTPKIDIDDVLKNVDVNHNASDFLSQYGTVIDTVVKKTKDGILEIKGLVKTGENEFREYTLSSTNGMDMAVKGTDENTDRIMKQIKNFAELQKAFERLNKVPRNVTDSIYFDKNGSDAEREIWGQLINYAQTYHKELSNITKISASVRQDVDGNNLVSFKLQGERGDSLTVGPHQDDYVASKQSDLTGIEEVRKRIKSLTSELKEYYSLRDSSQDSGFNRDVDRIRELESEYKNIINLVEQLNKEIPNNAAKGDLDSLNKLMDEKYYSDIRKYVENAQNLFYNKVDPNKYMPDFKGEIESAKSKITELISLMDAHSMGSGWTESEINKIREFRDEIEKSKLALKDDKSLVGNMSSFDKLLGKIQKKMNDNTGMPKDIMANYEELFQRAKELKNGGFVSKFDIAEIGGEFNNLNLKLEESGKTGKSFIDMVKSNAKRISADFFAMYMSMYDVIRYGRELVETVVQVDTAMAELEKVSDVSSSRLSESFEKSASTAKELGSSITDVVSSTADWSRLGYGVDEAEELARVTTLYQNVGDNITQEEASESLVSTLQGFQLDASEAENIIDQFNEVANNYAIDSKGIGEALKRSAASFNAANTDLPKSIALITAANEVVQDPEKVGNMWKTVSARLRGASTELKEMGEDTADLVSTTSKMQPLIKAITGVDIMKDKMTYEDIYDMILKIAKELPNLSDIEQAALIEGMAGKVHMNSLSAVLNNVETLEGAYETAMNAAGSAQEEQDRWAGHLQKSLDTAKASLQELSVDVLSSDFLKGFVDTGNTALNVLDKIVDKLGVFPTLMGGLGAFLGYTGRGFNPFFDENGKLSTKIFGTPFTQIKENRSLGLSLFANGVQRQAAKDLKTVDFFKTFFRNGGNLKNGSLENAVANSPQLAVMLNNTSAQTLGKINQGTNLDKISKQLQGVTASSKAATVGINMFGAALNMALFAGATFIVGKLAEVMSNMANNVEITAEKVDSAFSKYDSNLKKVEDHGKTIDSLKDKYTTLSKGVDNFGNNLYLDTSSYEEYKNVVNSIAEMYPDLLSYYNDQGVAVLKLKGNIDLLSEAYEKEKLAADNALISGDEETGSAKDIMKNFQNQVRKSTGPETVFGNLLESWEQLNGSSQKYGTSSLPLKTVRDTLKDFNKMSSRDIQNEIKRLSKMEDIDVDKNYQDLIERQALLKYLDDKFGLNTDSTVSDINEKRSSLNADAMTTEKLMQEEVDKIRQLGLAYLHTEEEYSKLDTNNKNLAESLVSNFEESLAESFTDAEGNLDEGALSEYVNSVYDTINNNPKLGESFDKLMNVDKSKENIHDYWQDIKKLSQDIGKETGDSWQDISQRLFNAKDINENYEKVKGMVKDWKSDFAKELTVEDLEAAMTLNLEDGAVSWDVFISKVRDAGSSIKALSFDIQSEQNKMSTLQTAMSNSFSGTGLSAVKDEEGNAVNDIESIKSAYSEITALYKEQTGKEWDWSSVFEHTAIGIQTNTEALSYLEGEYEKLQKNNLQEGLRAEQQEFEKAKQDSDVYAQAIKEVEKAKDQHADKTLKLADGEKTFKEATEDSISVLEQLKQAQSENDANIDNHQANIEAIQNEITQYEALISAYNKWQIATQTTNAGAAYDNVRTALEQMDKDYQEGKVGTDDFRQYANMFMYDDIDELSSQLSYNEQLDRLEAAYKHLDTEIDGTDHTLREFFADGREGAENYLDALEDVGAVTEDKNGNKVFDFDSDELAERWDTSAASIDLLNSKLKEYGFDIHFKGEAKSVNELNKELVDAGEHLKEYGQTADDVDKKAGVSLKGEDGKIDHDNLDKNLDKLKEYRDQTQKELDGLNKDSKEAQKKQSEIDYLNTEAQNAIAIKQAKNRPSILDSDISKIPETMKPAVESMKEFQDAADKVEMAEFNPEINLRKAQKELDTSVEDIKGKLKDLSGDQRIAMNLKPEMNDDEFDSYIDGLDSGGLQELIAGANADIELPVKIRLAEDIDISGTILGPNGEQQQIELKVKANTDEAETETNNLKTSVESNPVKIPVELDENGNPTGNGVNLESGTVSSLNNGTTGTGNGYAIPVSVKPKIQESDLSQELERLSQGGSVNLKLRPQIETSVLAEAGWSDVGEGYATTFTSTYSNEDGTVAINFTPIIADPQTGQFEGVLSPSELEQYASEVINGVRTDDLNLQIGAKFEGLDAIDRASQAAETEHLLQEEYYNSLNGIDGQKATIDIEGDTSGVEKSKDEAVRDIESEKPEIEPEINSGKVESEASSLGSTIKKNINDSVNSGGSTGFSFNNLFQSISSLGQKIGSSIKGLLPNLTSGLTDNVEVPITGKIEKVEKGNLDNLEDSKVNLDIEVNGEDKVERAKDALKQAEGSKTANLDLQVNDENVSLLDQIVGAIRSFVGDKTAHVSAEVDESSLEEAQTFADSLEAIVPKNADIEAEVDQQGLEETESLMSFIGGIISKDEEENVTTSGLDQVEALAGAIRGIVSKNETITVTTKYVTEGSPGGGKKKGEDSLSGTFAYGAAFANGNYSGYVYDDFYQSIPDNSTTKSTTTALVAEEGPEMLVTPDGRWELMGVEGAKFQNIPKGSIIFDAKQTEDLLNKGSIEGRGKGYGRPHLDGINGLGYANGNYAGVAFGNVTGSGRWRGGASSSNSSSSSSSSSSSKTDENVNNAANSVSNAANETAENSEETKKNSDKEKEAIDKIKEKIDEVSKKFQNMIDLREAKRENARNNYDYLERNDLLTEKKIHKYYAKENKAQIKNSKDARKQYKEMNAALEQAVADGKIERNSQEWVELKQKIVEAKNAAKEYARTVLQNIRDEIKARNELRLAKRDEKIDRNSDLSGSLGSAFTYTARGKNQQLRYQNSLLRSDNNAHDEAVAAASRSRNHYRKVGLTRINRRLNGEKAKNHKAYRNALKRAASAVKAKKLVSKKDMATIRKYAGKKSKIYRDLLSYNLEVQNVIDNNFERKIAVAQNISEMNANLDQKYNNRSEAYTNRSSLLSSRASNVTNTAASNSYLKDVRAANNKTLANEKHRVNRWQKEENKFANKALKMKKGKWHGTSFKGSSDKRREVARRVVNKAKSCMKAHKRIPDSILNWMTDKKNYGMISYAFWYACYRYNEAYEYRQQAEAAREAKYEETIQQYNETVEQMYSNRVNNINNNISLNTSKANNVYGTENQNVHLRQNIADNNKLLRTAQSKVNFWDSKRRSRGKKVTGISYSKARGNGYKGATAAERKNANKLIKHAKDYVKAKKRIPEDIIKDIDKVSKQGSSNLISRDFYQFCRNYNDAFDNKTTAEQERDVQQEATRQARNEAVNQIYDNKINDVNRNIELNNARASNAAGASNINSYLTANQKQNDKLVKIDQQKVNEWAGQQAIYQKEIKKTPTKGIGYNKATAHKRAAADKWVKKAKDCAKSGKRIPEKVIEWLRKNCEGERPVVSVGFYNACFNYNNAYDQRKQAQDALDLQKETSKQENAQLALQKFNNIKTKYDNKANDISRRTDRYQTGVSLAESKGYTASKKFYTAMRSNTSQNLKNTQAEAKALRKELESAVKSGRVAVGSDEWLEMANAIADCEDQALQFRLELNNLDKSIRELQWDVFDKISDRIDNLIERNNFAIDVISSEYEKLFDEDTGLINNHGLSIAGLHIANIEYYNEQIKRTSEEIGEMEKQVVENRDLLNNNDFIDRYNLLKNTHQDYIKNISSERNALRDLVKQGYDAQLDALKEIIDKRKEILGLEKDAYDYEKNIKDQVKNINSLQKRLSALSSDNSEETRAKIQQLQVELQNANEDLEETEYEKFISDQEKMLDDLYDDYEEFLNKRLDDLDVIVSEVISDVDSNTKDIQQTITDDLDKLGTNERIADDLAKQFDTSGDATILTNIRENIRTIIRLMEESQKASEEYIQEIKTANEADNEIRLESSKLAATNVINKNKSVSSAKNKRDNYKNSKEYTTAKKNYEAFRKKHGKEYDDLKAVYGKKVADNYFNDKKNNGIAKNVIKNWENVQAKYKSLDTEYKNKQTEANDYYKDNINDENRAILNNWFKSIFGVSPDNKKKIGSATQEDLKKRLKYWGVTNTKEKDLLKYWTNLGFNASDYKNDASHNNKIIKKMKEYGFSSGGTIGQSIKRSGEDGLILAKTGEEVLSIDKIKEMQKLVSNFTPVMDNIRQIADIPSITPEKASANNTNIENQQLLIELPNVTNTEDFMREIQNNKKMQKWILTTVGSSISGGNKYMNQRYRI